ncbi:transporter substrate-binding domain-containing protein [Rhizobium sp. DKSPLA3]|uniref:Transporter substrate-binding domain-containing protein n=1 Tax=Rhizobium quercicola TaxID=2901226 RepID=A0A9X1NX59_9HYPH|nr:transporter substrate-binding domain-containing protein [Rhizobium quercicola]MCD7111556.1 transporter substrate-binding domain-containing protein [Rhizobium quercicola]
MIASGMALLGVLLPTIPALAQSPETPETLQTLTLLTEEYPPFAFTQDGEITGSSVDQVRRIMAEVHPDYTLDIVPWARAIATAETDPATCVFTTTLLPERIPRFKWVSPLNIDTLMLVGRTGGKALPRSVEAAKAFTVAVHKDDLGEIFARKQGFRHVDTAPSIDLSLKKLLAGRVDLVLLTRKTFDDLRTQGEPLDAILDVETTRSGIACNKAVPDRLIADMQAVLDRLIADGTQAEMERRYANSAK